MFEGLLQGGSTANATVQATGNTVTVIPNLGFTGTLSLKVGVAQLGATGRGTTTDPFDTQVITITVTPFAGSNNQKFVTKVFQDLFNRAPSADELSKFSSQLDQGLPAASFALRLQQSFEGRIHQVQNLYQTLLGRPADILGQNFSASFLLQGGNVDVLKPILLGSPEFFTGATHGNNTANGFLNALFNTLFGHAIDNGTQSVFTSSVGTSDDDHRKLAAGLLNGIEAQSHFILQEYQQFLGRQPSTADAMFGAAAQLNGFSDEGEISGILSSPEFFQKLP